MRSTFISYAHEDQWLARELASGLRGAGCRVWIDEGELLIGDSLIQPILGCHRGDGLPGGPGFVASFHDKPPFFIIRGRRADDGWPLR